MNLNMETVLADFRFYGEVEVKGERLCLSSQGWESLRHWAVKLLVARYLLEAGFRANQIHFERRIGPFRADIFAEGEVGVIWVECGDFRWARIEPIQRIYTGKFIHAIPLQLFDREIEILLESERKQHGRINWRNIHRELVPPGCALWALSFIWTAPKLIYGIARGEGDKFAFIQGWSIQERLHPRKRDTIIRLSPGDQQSAETVRKALFAP